MAKKSKSKPKTKVSTVIDLCGRKKGATTAQIADRLDISKAAASSLINDARRAGVAIKTKKREDGTARYFV